MGYILSDRAEQICKKRYFMEDEDWEKCTYRVANIVSTAETTEQNKYRAAFHEIIFNMDFIPGGRILRNAGRPKGSLFNCYHLPVSDSIDGIWNFKHDAAILWSEGGGVGVNFSPIRPAGDPILGKGGHASGLVSFLKTSDFDASMIESGGSRRAAALCNVDVSHPEVLSFMDAKLKDKELAHYNISINITNDFVVAVESGADWEFIFNQKSYGSMPARKIWDKILDNMINSAEPGLLNTSNLYKNNSYYYAPILGTNPCLSGDTAIYTADGRGNVPIKQLAEEGRDVPVFCLNEKTEKLEVQMLRHPRVTGYNEKIYKITLDDGTFFRCTGNHKIRLLDGTYKEAMHLLPNDRLCHPIKYHASLKELFPKCNSKSQDYIWLNSGRRTTCSEHRLIAEFELGRKLKSGEIVHHYDYNAQNNNPDNLRVMSKREHDRLHTKDMMGENNPMNRFPEKNWLIRQNHSGSNNGRYKGISPKEVYELAKRHMSILNRKITKDEWLQICKDNGYPYSKHSFGGLESADRMLSCAARELGFNECGIKLRMYKQYLELKAITDLDIFFEDGSIYVNKVCETCKGKFTTKWHTRERAYCSRRCASISPNQKIGQVEGNKARQKETLNNQIRIYTELRNSLKRDPQKKEWEEACRIEKVPYRIRIKGEVENTHFNEYCLTSYKQLRTLASTPERNFKVASVEFDGYENVYNGTVDTHHNYLVHVGNSRTKSEKLQQNYVVTRQCGEVPLEAFGVCCLGSLVLPHFVSEGGRTNWQKLEETIRIAIRFLDDVIDVNKYTLKEIDDKAHLSRRVGLGFMGLAEYLFTKQVRYGSEESIVEIDRLMKHFRNYVYSALIDLSVEKGAFPKFDPIAYGKAHFIRTLPVSLRKDIKAKGVRCVTGMAVAPTGTISLLPEVSGGCEPLFARAYVRKDRVSERTYVHPIYQKSIENSEKIPSWFVDAFDLKPEDHFEIQSIIQRYVDGSVSKTINLPADATSSRLSGLLMEYIYDLKGVTVYRDGSRDGQILNRIPHEKVAKAVKANKAESFSVNEIAKCASGKCEL